MADSPIIYLRNSEAEEYFFLMRGPERQFLDYLRGTIIVSTIPTYPLKYRIEHPSRPIDLLFVYAHAVNTVKCFRSNYADAIKKFPVDHDPELITRADEARELGKSIQLEKCRIFVEIYDSLLASTQLIFEGRLDLYWMYRLLMVSLSSNGHFDCALSRSEDFETPHPDEVEWGKVFLPVTDRIICFRVYAR